MWRHHVGIKSGGRNCLEFSSSIRRVGRAVRGGEGVTISTGR